MTSETDEQFVERLAADRNGPIYEAEMSRLFALARRGAALEDHGQNAKLSEETTLAGGQR